MNGELYWFNEIGRLICPPIQLENEITSLYLSPSFPKPLQLQNTRDEEKSNGYHRLSIMFLDARKEYTNVYLQVLTTNCLLIVWKIALNEKLDFVRNPSFCLKTSFAHLLKSNGSHPLLRIRNSYVSIDGCPILMLSNNYVYMYTVNGMKCWMRLVDDRYSMSECRRSITVNDTNSNHRSEESKMEDWNSDQLLNVMNKHMANEESVYLEQKHFHTLSHLEHQLLTTAVLKNANAFEKVLNDYFRSLVFYFVFVLILILYVFLELVEYSQKSALTFIMYKLDDICLKLLNYDSNNSDFGGNCFWNGSLEWQRSLLQNNVDMIIGSKLASGKTTAAENVMKLMKKYKGLLHTIQR